MDQALSQEAGVYEIVNLTNGRRYVGSSVRLGQRRREHFKRLRAGTHSNPPLQAAFIKYGEQAFEFRVLAVLESDEVLPTEQRALDQAARSGERLYNVAVDVASGMKGRHHSAETKAALSAKHRKYFSDPEARRRHSEIKSAHAADPAVRQRLSDAQKKRFSDPEVRLANVLRQREVNGTPEARERQRALTLAHNAANPQRSKQHAESLRELYADPAARAAASDRMKAFYATPAGMESIRKMKQSKRDAAARKHANVS